MNAGIKQIEVGVEGNVLGEYNIKEAKAGANIVLTIDSNEKWRLWKSI